MMRKNFFVPSMGAETVLLGAGEATNKGSSAPQLSVRDEVDCRKKDPDSEVTTGEISSVALLDVRSADSSLRERREDASAGLVPR